MTLDLRTAVQAVSRAMTEAIGVPIANRTLLANDTERPSYLAVRLQFSGQVAGRADHVTRWIIFEAPAAAWPMLASPELTSRFRAIFRQHPIQKLRLEWTTGLITVVDPPTELPDIELDWSLE